MYTSNDFIRFFVLGDWGRQGDFGQQETADCMAEVAKTVKPNFVFTTGDNFYENGVADTEDILWELSYETVYHHKSLHIPWYAVLGNHDYMGNPEAQVEYTLKSKRWRMPARYYSLTYLLGFSTEVLFLFIDTSALISSHFLPDSKLNVKDQNTEKQYQWIAKQLKESRAAWKIVIGHHPLFSAGVVHGDNEELIARLKPIFDAYEVQAYFCGHDHDAQHLKPYGASHYFVTGAGSLMRDFGTGPHTIFASNLNSFIDVVMMEEFMKVRFVNSQGVVMHSVHIDQQITNEPLTYISG
jgi:hypothetical protein